MQDRSTRPLLADAASRAADYLDGLGERSVGPRREATERLAEILNCRLPDGPSEPADVLAILDEYGSPATVANAGGRYFGFVTGGALPVTVAAQFLAVAWDQNAFSFVSSPTAALFEIAALRWVTEALDLPTSAAGALVTGATMANFTCLAAARNAILKQSGWDVDRDGLIGAPELTIVAGEESHASLHKVFSLLGLGRNRVRLLPVDAQGRIRADALPEISPPAIVCIQAGNVNSGAFDPAKEIVEWAHAAGAWVHVDGAFGLWALASAEHAGLAEGFAGADSWATDAHKWLNVPYDCGVALVRNSDALIRAMSMTGSYLLPSGRRDAMNVTPDSSRRARAIELWAALISLGRSGLADLVSRNCQQARRSADALRRGGVDVLNEVVLNQVVVAFGNDERTNRVIATVQHEGTCWCGGTTWRGRAAMRISLSSWATTDDDVDSSVEAILRAHHSASD